MGKNTYNITRRDLLGVSSAVAVASGLSLLPTSQAASAARDKVKKVSPLIPEGLRGANVSLIASAMQKVGLDSIKQSMAHDIKPLVPIGETVIGPAVTTKWEKRQGRYRKEDVDKFYFDVLDNAAAGSVWVIASGTVKIYSLYGDVICSALKRDGMMGAVSDNGCRDIADIEALGFPVFGRATVQFGPPRDSIHPVAGNVPVVCGGAVVNPGDLVAADGDGVIIIPQSSLIEVEKAVIKHRAKEDGIRAMIQSGKTLKQSYPQAD